MAEKKSEKKKLVDKIVRKIAVDAEAVKDLAEEMSDKVITIIKDEAISKLIADEASLKATVKKVLQDEGAVEDLAEEIGDDLEDEVSDKLKENTKLQKEVLGVIVKDNRFKKELRGQLKDEMSGNDDD